MVCGNAQERSKAPLSELNKDQSDPCFGKIELELAKFSQPGHASINGIGLKIRF